MKRIRLMLLAIFTTCMLVVPVATAPPASAANLYGFPNAWLVAKTLNFSDSGQHIGDLTVWYDGVSIAAYFEHVDATWNVATSTSITLCFTQWYDGPNVGIDDYGIQQSCGIDSGWFSQYAGPAIPNPSVARHREYWKYGVKPFRATATMLWPPNGPGAKYYSFYINAAGGVDGTFHPFNCCWGH